MKYRNVTFYAPQKVICRVRLTGPRQGYFAYIQTKRRCQKQGYCTSLLSFILDYLNFAPEFDIRNQSRVMKRIATRFGYERIGTSERFLMCERWLKNGTIRRVRPRHRFYIINKIGFNTDDFSTLVLYLSASIHGNDKTA